MDASGWSSLAPVEALRADSPPGRKAISMQGGYHEESRLHATGSRCVSLINVAERMLRRFGFLFS